MDKQEVLNQFKNWGITGLQSVVRSGINAVSPRSIEVYILTLELLTGYGDKVMVFSFPILPSQITILEPASANIKKTFKGYTIINSEEYFQRTITIQGNFGREIRFVSGNGGLSNLISAFWSPDLLSEHAYYSLETNSISQTGYYSGFGCIKLLQSIIERSRIIDTKDGKRYPRQLLLYNNTFSEIYDVKVKNCNYNQSVQTNGVWNYEIVFDAVNELTRYNKDKTLADRLGDRLNGLITQGTSMINKGISKVVKDIPSLNPSKWLW